jgi:hypothetical protein
MAVGHSIGSSFMLFCKTSIIGFSIAMFFYFSSYEIRRAELLPCFEPRPNMKVNLRVVNGAIAPHFCEMLRIPTFHTTYPQLPTVAMGFVPVVQKKDSIVRFNRLYIYDESFAYEQKAVGKR